MPKIVEQYWYCNDFQATVQTKHVSTQINDRSRGKRRLGMILPAQAQVTSSDTVIDCPPDEPDAACLPVDHGLGEPLRHVDA